jgi:hypothetical protein
MLYRWIKMHQDELNMPPCSRLKRNTDGLNTSMGNGIGGYVRCGSQDTM